MKRLDRILTDLTERALLSSDQAGHIRRLAFEGDDTPLRVIIRQGVIDQQVLAGELSRLFSLQRATEWPDRHVLPNALSLRFMRERHVLPATTDGGKLIVILSDPTDEKTLSAIRLAADMELEVRIASDDEVTAAIERLEQVQSDASEVTLSTPGAEDDDTLKDLALDAPAIDLLNRLFREASSVRATDPHIEAARGHTTVRRRVDGLPAEVERLPTALGRAAVSRLKILTNLDIAEKR